MAVEGNEIVKWLEMVDRLAAAKNEEMAARKRIAENLFPSIQRGTQEWRFGDSAGLDYVAKRLTCSYSQSFKVDVAALTLVAPRLIELGVNPNDLVEWKPELKKKAYDALTDEQRAIADEAITYTWGSPTIKLADLKKRG